jgi:hypothetical protein
MKQRFKNSVNSITAKKRSKSKKQKKSIYWLLIPVVVFICAMVGFGFILFASNSKLALERALINTFDRGRQQSGRYQGSVVLDESDVRVDFNGQIASTGERSFGMGLVYRGEVFKLDVLEMQDRTYVRLQRPAVLLQALEGAPGVGSIGSIDASLLESMSGSWVSLSKNELSLVTNNIPCMDSLPTIGINVNERSQQYFPFAISNASFGVVAPMAVRQKVRRKKAPAALWRVASNWWRGTERQKEEIMAGRRNSAVA